MLYQQIDSNKRKTVGIMIGFTLFVLAIGSVTTYIYLGSWISGVIFAFVIAVFYCLIMLTGSTKMIMGMNGAREVAFSEEQPYLWNTVEGLAMVARIPMPKIYLINDKSPNAFATGISPNNSAVAVTIGLIELLSREELEGVIAHEISHIKNYDIRLSTVAIALVGVVAILAHFGTRFLFIRKSKKVDPILMIIGIFLLILSPIIATMIQLALSRNREYLADASGAELCRNPIALANALQKISDVHSPVKHASQSCAALYFNDPFKKKKTQLFSTHPPTEERIRRLLNM
ncbi:MAG: zinc metalloprotease HtpX [Bacillota bacterium]|nr:zinc metalloprotease HtpX [Bacillota bacterium]